MIAAFLADGYKFGHAPMFPKGTEYAYSNFTPRSNKYAPKGCDEVVVFGTTMAMQKLDDSFQKEFFKLDKDYVIAQIKGELSMYFGMDYDTTPFEKLHDLGYLPIKVKALREGTLCPIKVPMLTIVNTNKEFYWLPNFLETILSNLLWKPMTSATIAFSYKKLLTKWALKTDSSNVGFVDFQAHDFSMRGLDSIDATIASGLGHLTSFKGTDSLPAIMGARQYYKSHGFVAGSVPATEHSVMCAGGKESEIDTFRRLLNLHPKGILSVVSDTWDLWKVLTEYLPTLKEEILARDGKLVIRPDSGDPVDIICGTIIYKGKEDFKQASQFDKEYSTHITNEEKGVIELLWDVFGGTINEQGYKVLDSHIGAIYGDSITIDRAEEICKRLEAKGFASTNIVLGIGSYTYQYNTRDSLGFAMKATWVQINGEGMSIFKDPITDDGMKKSLKGLLKVYYDQYDKIQVLDECDPEEEETGLLELLYQDGIFYQGPDLEMIRERLNKKL